MAKIVELLEKFLAEVTEIKEYLGQLSSYVLQHSDEDDDLSSF